MKSPKPNKRNKPPQTTQQCSPCWRPKNYYKEKYSPLNPTGSKMRKPQKLNTITCQPIHLNAAETPNSIQKRYVFHIPNRHTPTNKPPRPAGRQTNQHTTMHTKNKKYIGTLLSSQTSSPHNNHTLSHVARREQKIYFVRACFPIAASARNFAVPVGRCRSR